MTPFTTLTGMVAPLLSDNIDTDTIIPSRDITSTGRTGLAEGLFAPWRYIEGRLPNPEFVLNQPNYTSAPILAGGANFGCGSSREHAVWALDEYGIRAIIAPSFAPIFVANCIRNGLLPVALSGDAVTAVAGRLITIDLAAQQVICGAQIYPFPIDTEAKTMLLEGLDAIDLTLKSRAAIDIWTQADSKARPWIYL